MLSLKIQAKEESLGPTLWAITISQAVSAHFMQVATDSVEALFRVERLSSGEANRL